MSLHVGIIVFLLQQILPNRQTSITILTYRIISVLDMRLDTGTDATWFSQITCTAGITR